MAQHHVCGENVTIPRLVRPTGTDARPSCRAAGISSRPQPAATNRGASMRRPDLVVVVAGGLSFEREISLASGRQVADALRDADVEVMTADADDGLLATLATVGTGTVVFMALHGPVGEDGALQDVLDAYAAVSEETFRDLGAKLVLDRFGQHLGFPLVVKPTRGGSAFGVSVVGDREELPQAMVKCFNHGGTALLEAYVEGTEVAVGVVECPDGRLVLPPVEIVPVHGIYDFESRYNPGQTEYFVPARLPPQALEEVSAAARTVHTTLGLRHISRSDFIVDPAGKPQFLEITGSPGLTETSIILLAMREMDLTPPQVFTDLVAKALK